MKITRKSNQIDIVNDVHKTTINIISANICEVTVFEDMSYFADEPRWVALGGKELWDRKDASVEFGIII